MKRAASGKQMDQSSTGACTPPDQEPGLAALTDIGLSGESLRQLCRLIDDTAEGIILITGPAGSGRMSTFYAVIRWLRSRAVNLVSLEDLEEHADQAARRSWLTFANVLRPALLHSPDVIAMGEIRDAETAKIAVQAVMTGRLVLSTMEADSAQAAMRRLLEIGLEHSLIARAVKGVVSQRLVRRLCPCCRRAYTPSPDQLARLGMPAGDYPLYQSAGCADCSGSGYGGRTGVFEVLAVDSAMRQAIRAQSRTALEEAIAASGTRSIADSCRQLVLDGVVSPQEAAPILEEDRRGTAL